MYGMPNNNNEKCVLCSERKGRLVMNTKRYCARCLQDWITRGGTWVPHTRRNFTSNEQNRIRQALSRTVHSNARVAIVRHGAISSPYPVMTVHTFLNNYIRSSRIQ